MYLIKRRVKKMSGAYREDCMTTVPADGTGFWEILNSDDYKFIYKFSTKAEALFIANSLPKGPEYLVEEYIP